MTAALLALLALAASPEVQKALDTYDYGDYAKACQQLEALRRSLFPPPLAEEVGRAIVVGFGL